MEISDEVRATLDRRRAASAEISDRITAAIEMLPPAALIRILRLYVGEVGYLGEHLPTERENVTAHPCSDETWHCCSFMGVHDPGCKAVGGNGTLQNEFLERARSCEPDCDSAGAEQPWCHVAGFDCDTCAMVDELLGLLAYYGVPDVA